jgi:L-aminopeptidase/D-esterase-like protein
MGRTWFCAVLLAAALAARADAQEAARPRARDLGFPFSGTPGPLNAITDVAGVEVGHSTLISGEGKLEVGAGPVRTGVTAILPRGRASLDNAFAGVFSLNGNGEMTGTAWLQESGFLEGPVMLTNTHSVGVVRDAVIAWRVKRAGPDASGYWWSLPVVGETWDGELNDINGFHVKERHAFEAIETARGGPVQEGSVGGGTGMICYDFKGGIGTASRKLAAEDGGWTVGALVQCNCGWKSQLVIGGVPVGHELEPAAPRGKDGGSILIVIATDAPLLPHQLERLARRASLGLARTGSVSGNGSGDLFLAFSTANGGVSASDKPVPVTMLPNDSIDPVFEATVQATEEAIVNAMVAAEPMTGINGFLVQALPQDKVRDLLRRHGRLAQASDASGRERRERTPAPP